MSAIAATASRSVGGEAIYVPYTLGGETVEVEDVPGHPDRRRLLAVEHRQPGADRAVLPAFRRLRRLRDPALGGRRLPRLEARPRRRDAGSRPSSNARSRR